MGIPKTMIWEITKQCNFHCPHCIVSSDKNKPKEEMNLEQAKYFLDRYRSAGGEIIGFSGGEPLLRNDLEEIISYASKLGFQGLSIASNGSIATESRLKSLRDAGVRYMQFSLDGANWKQYSRIRKKGKKVFEKVLDSIRLAQSAGIETAAGTFLHPHNIDSIPEIVELCKKEGVSLLRFSGYVPLGRGRKQVVIDKMGFSWEQMKNFFEYISSYNPQETKVTLGFDHAFGPFLDPICCNAGKEIFYMNSVGEIYPCPAFLHPHFKIGSIFGSDENHLFNILNSKQLKSCQSAGENIAGTCAKCPDFSWCQGGCRGTAYAYSEDLNASFPNCLRNLQRQYSEAFDTIAPPLDFKQREQFSYSNLNYSPESKPNHYNTITNRNSSLKKKIFFGSNGIYGDSSHIEVSSSLNRIENNIKKKPVFKKPSDFKAGFKTEFKNQPNTKMKKLSSNIFTQQQIDYYPPDSQYYHVDAIAIDSFYQNHANTIKSVLAAHPLNYLLWESTLNCNFLCRHCSSPREKWNKQREMTTEQAKTVFRKIAEDFDVNQIQALGITGGEPALRKDLPEMIKYLTGLGFRTAIDTNGYLTGRNPKLIENYYNAGLRNICISVDGLRNQMKAFRGVDGFLEVVKTIETIKKHYSDIFVQTITMVSKHNISSLDDIFSLLESLDVSFARFGTIMSVGRAPEDDQNFLSPDETRKLLTWIARKRNDYLLGKTRLQVEFTDNGWCGKIFEPFGFEGAVRQSCFFCTAGVTMGIITYDGNFGGCLSVPEDINIQGNLLTERPGNVWRERFDVFRNKEKLKTGACAQCDNWNCCLGGGMHERDEKLNIKSCTYQKIRFV